MKFAVTLAHLNQTDDLLEYYESQLEWYGNTKYLLELETRELCEKLLQVVEAGISYDLCLEFASPWPRVCGGIRTMYGWESS
jgi:hypothetical protein